MLLCAIGLQIFFLARRSFRAAKQAALFSGSPHPRACHVVRTLLLVGTTDVTSAWTDVTPSFPKSRLPNLTKCFWEVCQIFCFARCQMFCQNQNNITRHKSNDSNSGEAEGAKLSTTKEQLGHPYLQNLAPLFFYASQWCAISYRVWPNPVGEQTLNFYSWIVCHPHELTSTRY